MSNKTMRVLFTLVAFVMVAAAAPTPSTVGKPLTGVVKSIDGKPLEGVAVSARAEGKSFTTTVYTGPEGMYFFPPLDDGNYKLWAQAVGFDAARAEVTLSNTGSVEKNLTLQPLQDFASQLSTVEWMSSLPATTPQDRRAKRLLAVNCNTCHQAGMVLRNRFDAKSWNIILDFMEHTGGDGGIGRESLPFIKAYREEILAYLLRVRGPDSPPLKLQPLPRPAGESTHIVVTEYDIPPGHQPGVPVFDNGSDWSLGIPSHYESRSPHDAVVDQEGNVWFTDQATPKRTIGKLDSKTGRVTDYTFLDEHNVPMATHDIALDRMGNVWTAVSPYDPKAGRRTGDGFFVRFDSKEEKFHPFPVPDSLPPVGSGLLNIDSKGNVWASVSGGARPASATKDVRYNRPKFDSAYPGGAIKLDPTTGKYTYYKSVTPAGSYYGVIVDAKDNAWFVQPGYERVNVLDSRTGKVSEVSFLPLPHDDVEYTAQDRKLAANVDPGPQTGPPWHLGPRRGSADKNSNVLWYGAAQGNQLVKFDINTKKVLKQYPMPSPYSFPYFITVDKNHMVWITATATDQFFKFNPVTEHFTAYPLPTRGTDVRFANVDNSTDQPTLWLPYYGASKIARIQFRTDAH